MPSAGSGCQGSHYTESVISRYLAFSLHKNNNVLSLLRILNYVLLKGNTMNSATLLYYRCWKLCFSVHATYLDQRGHDCRGYLSSEGNRIDFLNVGKHLSRSSNPVLFHQAPPCLVEYWGDTPPSEKEGNETPAHSS